MKNWIAIGIAVAVATAGMRLAKPASAAGEKVLFASVGASTRPPIGWLGSATNIPESVTPSQTAYRFIKRQSQSDPNVWVTIEAPRPATASAMPR
jgi:predicted transglutaminase-like cysteine proteinase